MCKLDKIGYAVSDMILQFPPAMRTLSQNISYDDILTARRFSAVIYKQENMYADRAIEDYLRANALFQLREADRIKEMIRAFEMDMWVY